LPDYSDIAAPQPASHLAEDVQTAMEPDQDMRQRQQPSVAPNFPDLLEKRSHVANVEKKPVRQEIRPGSRPSTAPVQATLPIAAARRDTGETPLFQYDGVSNVRTLGKKDAPRATRSVQPTR
jgi:hypothetical protein